MNFVILTLQEVLPILYGKLGEDFLDRLYNTLIHKSARRGAPYVIYLWVNMRYHF